MPKTPMIHVGAVAKQATSNANAGHIILPEPAPLSSAEPGDIAEEVGVDLGKAIGGQDAHRYERGDMNDPVQLEAFMHERVTINISPPASDNDQQVATVVVNNRHYTIPRARSVVVPRFLVETLARAKQENYRMNPRALNDPEQLRTLSTHVFSYPFQVVNDSPAGLKWLERVLHEPQ